VRFPDRLRVSVEIPPSLSAIAVRALILQPLMENAIRYAVEPSDRQTTIKIVASRQGNKLQLVVKNDNVGTAEVNGGTGLGLKNVRERLKVHFGDRARLTAGPTAEDGYRAEIEIPIGDAR